MSKRASPTIIGAFVVGAVALAVVALAILGSGRLFHKQFKFVLYFDSDVNGLNVGSPVKFRGVEIGSVVNILLNINALGVPVMQASNESARLPVIIQLDEEKIRQKGGRVRFGEPEMVEQSIQAGLRAQLASESFVTGLLYVKLDLQPDTPVRLVGDPTVPYPELPTIPTPLEEAQIRASQLLMKLEQVDFAGLISSLHSTVDGMNKIVNSPKLGSTIDGLDETVKGLNETIDSVRTLSDELRAQVGPLTGNLAQTVASADAMLQQSQTLLAHVDTVLQPDAPLQYQIRMTMQEVSNAARSVRVLADSIERNPSVLVRGRAAPREK